MFGLGVGEIVIILFIALIFIGPKKLPELAKGLGKGMREFQNAARGLGENLRNPVDEVKKQVMDQPENLDVKQEAEDHGEEFVSIDDLNQDQARKEESDKKQKS